VGIVLCVVYIVLCVAYIVLYVVSIVLCAGRVVCVLSSARVLWEAADWRRGLWWRWNRWNWWRKKGFVSVRFGMCFPILLYT